MEYLEKRDNDPAYLRTVIAQREIVIEEEQRLNRELRQELNQTKAKFQQHINWSKNQADAAALQISNLKVAISTLQSDLQSLRQEKCQVQFQLNSNKQKLREEKKENSNKIDKIKGEAEIQKSTFTNKIQVLENNLADMKKHYKVQEGIGEDKHKIIVDSNRDLKGFSNQKQQRLIILQNQQYKNELQYQSRRIVIELQRKEKLQQEIKTLKSELQLEKDIQNDLIKRLSLAQTLIKKLNKELANKQTPQSPQVQYSEPTNSESRVSTMSDQISKLNLQNASLKNYNHYLQNMQQTLSKKYQTLGTLMADYLQRILHKDRQQKDMQHNNESIIRNPQQISIQMSTIKEKSIREWSTEEVQIVFDLLWMQIKPFLTKQSLLTFPQVKNVNITFVEENNQQPLQLPRIVKEYEDSCTKEAKRNRFKDIPLDISTKILRSDLREWGPKVPYLRSK